MNLLNVIAAFLVSLCSAEGAQREGWRPILDFFTTHPTELHHLAIDTAGDGHADETITGTSVHPFWVEEAAEFTPMRDLTPGMRLTTARSTRSVAVVSNIRERAPPGESFTTYNFEVADFHTYFVGGAGVWVHNSGQAHCQKLFSLFDRFIRTADNNPWDAHGLAMQRFDGLVGADSRLAKDGVARLQIFTEARRRHFTDLPGANRPWLSGGQTLTLTNPPAGPGQMATELAANMEKIYLVGKPKGFAAHHIVPPGYNDAAGNASRLRQLLDQHGIHLNEAGNGVFIPHFKNTAEAFPSLGPSHNTLHTDAMMAKLWTRLDGVPNPDKTKLLDELQKIAFDIVEGNLMPN